MANRYFCSSLPDAINIQGCSISLPCLPQFLSPNSCLALPSLHQKAKGYLEQCMEAHQKRANDPREDGNALAALLS